MSRQFGTFDLHMILKDRINQDNIQAFVSTYIRRHELIDSDLLDDEGAESEVQE